MEDQPLPKSSHLHRRGGNWTFRRRVPDELRQIIGKQEITKSIGGDFRRACEERNRLVVETDRLFADARARMSASSNDLSAFSIEALEAMVSAWGEVRLQRVAPPSSEAENDGDEARDTADLEEELFNLRNSPERISRRIELTVADILAENGFTVTYPQIGRSVIKSQPQIRIDRSTPQYRFLEQRVRAELDRLNVAKALRLRGATPVEAILPTPAALQFAPVRKLNAAIEEFASDPARRSRDAKRDLDYGMIFDVLREVIGGDTEFQTISRSDCIEARELLLRLPPHARKSFPGLGFGEIADIADAQGDVRKLTPQTVNSHLAKISAFFNWAVEREYIERNPIQNLKIRGASHSIADRDPYSLDELKLIFESAQFRNKPEEERDERFWLPILGLYQGARANELAQLLVADIREEGGLMGFAITPSGGGKRLKTVASKRLIPVHPTIMQLGFRRYVENVKRDGQERLWPNLRPCPRGYYSTYFLRWFSRYLEAVEVKVRGSSRDGDAFHPFRHCWADAAREADISLPMQEAIGGWTQTTAHSKYGSGYSLRRLTGEIAKIAFPGLDIAQLR